MDAGYSGTSQARKLGIKPGLRVVVVGAAAGWALDDPSPTESAGEDGSADLMLVFVRAADELSRLPALAERVYPDGALWVAWPRKAAGHVSDVTENGIRDAVLPHGLVDVKVAAIDADWSGLKIVWRKAARRVETGSGRSTH